MKMMWTLVFLLLPIIGLSYVGWHIWCLLPLACGWKIAVISLMAVSFLLLFANFWHLPDRLPLSVGSAIYEVGTSSIFVLLYLFMLFLVLDLGRLVRLVPRELLYANWWTTGSIALVLIGVFAYGFSHYQHKYREELTIMTDKVTQPTKLVMMSDLHVGYHNRRAELARWVDLVGAEHPDLVVIAGDIIDGSIRPLIEEKMHEEFSRIGVPVYACLGNHEYYSGEADAQRFYDDAGIHLLRDTVITLGQLCIVGRDDRTNPQRKSIEALMALADTTKYCILLDHQPYHLEEAEWQRVDLQFSGHTHHGQVWPISWITESMYECAFGRYKRGDTDYYVSSGMGIWGGKFRIGTRSEYVVLNILPAER